MNILFTNAGRRTYLIEYTLELKKQGKDINLFVSDTSVNTAAFYVDSSVKALITPRVSGNEQEYIHVLEKYIEEYKIDLIIPLMDFELYILAKHKKKFQEIGAEIIVSDADFIEHTLNKKLTEGYCENLKIPYPKTFYTFDSIPNGISIIRKKIEGSGSVGLTFHDDKSTLQDFEEGLELVQERIVGEEFGLDILNDQYGNFVHASAKIKHSMRSGETDKATTVYDEEMFNFAKYFSLQTKHIGNVDVDIIKDSNGNFVVIDINPRFGGGYPFTHAAGFNYIEAIINMYSNCKVVLPKKGKKITGMKGVSVFYTEIN